MSYFLYILLFPAILGFVINLITLAKLRRVTTENDPAMTELKTMFWGHHLWLFRTFIITVCFGMAGLGTIYYAVGYFLVIGAVIWWFYRIVRGATALYTFHPVPVWV